MKRPSFFSRIVVTISSWVIKKKYGKVITHMDKIYSKKIPLLFLANRISIYEEQKINLSQELVLLIKAYGSMLNGCSFCEDLALAMAIQKKMGEQKFLKLNTWELDAEYTFSNSERAVLKLIKDYSKNRVIPSETMLELRKYFNEQEVVDIVTVNAIENFYNALSIPFGIKSDGLAQIARTKTKN